MNAPGPVRSTDRKPRWSVYLEFCGLLCARSQYWAGFAGVPGLPWKMRRDRPPAPCRPVSGCPARLDYSGTIICSSADQETGRRANAAVTPGLEQTNSAKATVWCAGCLTVRISYNCRNAAPAEPAGVLHSGQSTAGYNYSFIVFKTNLHSGESLA